MALPTIKEIHNAKAGPLWNLLCCPLVMTIGMIYRSFTIFCLPCINVLSFRCVHSVWKYCCCCLSWPYEDESFIGASALGDFSVEGKETAAQMEAQTDWVRAQDLKTFKGKRPQLFEGEIEPSDLAQGAVGDCWLVAAFACASEFPDCIRRMFSKYNVKLEIHVSYFYLRFLIVPQQSPKNIIRVASTKLESTILSRKSLRSLSSMIEFLAKRERTSLVSCLPMEMSYGQSF